MEEKFKPFPSFDKNTKIRFFEENQNSAKENQFISFNLPHHYETFLCKKTNCPVCDIMLKKKMKKDL